MYIYIFKYILDILMDILSSGYLYNSHVTLYVYNIYTIYNPTMYHVGVIMLRRFIGPQEINSYLV